MGETLRSDLSCVVTQFLEYLVENQFIAKSKIENLGEHYPNLRDIVDKFEASGKVIREASWRGWIVYQFGKVHEMYHGSIGKDFQACPADICKSAVQSLKELS